MNFQSTEIDGVFVIGLEQFADDRGFFARSWCDREAAAAGLDGKIVQASISFNHHRGTVRGMHFQRAPSEEVKVVRCVSGAIHDVVVDLREDSSTYLGQFCIDLSADNHMALYIPEGMAHGFQTLADRTEVHYQMNAYYDPDAASGLRYDDPKLDIQWPLPVSVISEKDRSWPDFDEARS